MPGHGRTAGILLEFSYSYRQAETSKSGLYIKVSGYWSKYKLNESWLPKSGYASYRIILRGLEYSNSAVVYIHDFGSACLVFIDGVLTAESGMVSKNLEEVFTVPRAELYPVVLSDKDNHEVVIEVATTRFAGLYKAPVMKDFATTVKENERKSGIRFILFGMVLFSFFVLIYVNMLSYKKVCILSGFPR